MTEDHEAAEVAKGLTKAQQVTLVDNRRCVRSYKPAQILVERGLWEDAGDDFAIYAKPTPLGLRVRAHLQGETA